MPRLTILERTYGKAIGCLIALYKKEPGFVEELQKIRSVYEPAVIKWLDSSVPQWRRLQAELIQAKGRQDDSIKLTDMSIELSEKLLYGIKRFYEGWNVTSDLINYEKELRGLAYRWHLKAKWSGLTLILNHFYDVVGITQKDIWNADIPIEAIEPMLDKPPLSPLIFKVTAYELMYSDQGEIVQRFAKRLSDYEKELKSLGWKELPSAMKTHASWWFEHYVHKKKYPDIALEYGITAESIKRAVFNFRRFLQIDIG